jgi:plastocyanin
MIKSQNPYNASQITVPAGSDVTWINNDESTSIVNFLNKHTITSGSPVKWSSNIFYSQELQPFEKFTFTFNKPRKTAVTK